MADISIIILKVFLLNLCIFLHSAIGASSSLSSNQQDLKLRDGGGRVERSKGCSNDAKQLKAVPNHADMYGGRLVDLSGPCFATDKPAYCQFKNPHDGVVLANQEAVDISRTRVLCVVPRLLVRDRVILSVSTDNGKTYPYSTNFTIVFPGRMPPLVRNLGRWFFPDATVLSLEWDNTLLTNDRNSLVDIRLIGFKENDGKAIYKPLITLGKDVPASNGEYEFEARNYQCTGQDCFEYEVGLVEVKLQEKFTPTKNKFLSTNRVPLGWFVRNVMKAKYGSDWPSDLCMKWHKSSSRDMKWFGEILKCPCSLAQAIADFGRWQPDKGCNLQKAANPRNCFYHNAAVHCVRSVQPVNGAGNQCCYSAKGYLVFAADTYFGSTADKSHDWGAAPYGKPGHVPILSHWVDDIIPLFSCCQWTNFKSCDYYVQLRGTTDCTEYNPPVPAFVYGQGHIATLRGQKIRVMAPGDYILLKAGTTEVQARFENNLTPTESGKVINNTFTLTSVAIESDGISDRVELRLQKDDTKNIVYIEVLLNGEIKEFKEKSLKWQDFKGVAVINTDLTGKNDNYTVLLTNNIGFQVATVAGTMQLDLMMPTDIIKVTSGIFGNIDGGETLSNGESIDLFDDANKPEDVYNFEKAWKVKNNNLFKDSKTFPTEAIFNPKSLSLRIRSQTYCTISRRTIFDDCEFDYTRTGSEAIAKATQEAGIRRESLIDNLEPIRSCGLLDVPRSKKSSYEYTIGTTTTVTECRSGSLSGNTTYTCVDNLGETQAWSPDVTAKCELETEMEMENSSNSSNTGMIVGIVIAVLVVVAIIIIVVVLVFVRKRRNGNRKDGAPYATDEAVAMKPEDVK
ncbi:sushi domain-containing protein 2-like [Ruditapes philippinarum]|uniref:sushi domain-containing protein 2-like n=1 Tax=Ruditapes philippinarum TaxID=129788 RepID=UPI00295B14C2|nr:sushi domain-containing protein 2-like [Ruditapes philippinarum]